MEKKRCCQASGNWTATRAEPSGAPSPWVVIVACTAQCAGAAPLAATGVAWVTLTLRTCRAFSASTVQAGAARAADAVPASSIATSVAADFAVANCILVLPSMAGITSHADPQPSNFEVVPQRREAPSAGNRVREWTGLG